MHRFSRLALAVLLAAGCWTTARAQIYIAYSNVGMVSEYDQQSGALINEQFILGLKRPRGLCVANGVLYIAQADTGYIGTYDLHTGAPIHPELVSGINQPQVMTVSGDAIYVTGFDWQTSQPIIGKYNAFTGAAINASLVKITGAVINGTTMTPDTPGALAASGNKLYVGNTDGPSGASVYDATTGALITGKLVPMLFTSDYLMVDDKWLWLVAGTTSSTGVIYKVDRETGRPPSEPIFIMRPFITHVDHPGQLAIAGDDLFIGQGIGTGVARYNATSGALINANFIPSKGDIMGGLAVVPRAISADEASADSTFEVKQSLGHMAFMMAVYWQYTFAGTCLVLLLFILGIVAFFLRRTSPKLAPVVEESVAEELPAPDEVPAQPIAEESPTPTAPPPEPVSSGGLSALAVIAIVLVGITLVTAGVLTYLILVPPDLGAMPKLEADYVGEWGSGNEPFSESNQKPVFRDLVIYPTHAGYSAGNGSHDLPGTWHDNGFWIPNADGSGETEIAQLLDPLNMQVHVAAFIPSDSEVVTLYKVAGSAAEKQAIAAKYPAPLTYPPPKGVITYDMSQYDLESLPWRVDYVEAVGDEAYSRGTLYHYHSDNPKIPPLEVTIKLRHVVEIHGGYE